jgi:two-component system, chemotaxis family, protein-glutamate methylesterase/glutaminase
MTEAALFRCCSAHRERTERGTTARVVAVGASAGGGKALLEVLRPLPTTYPHPILVVQHQAEGGSTLLAEALASELHVDTREGRSGEPILPTHVYVAPSGYHMLVESDRRLALSVDEPVCFSRPSIDVLFESGAAAYGQKLIAILLTGANDDGARGLVTAWSGGALTIVQDPTEAEFPEMPAAALARLSLVAEGDSYHVLQLAEIARLLVHIGSGGGAPNQPGEGVR